MEKFIDDLHSLFDFLNGKNIAGKYAPDKIDLTLWEVSIQLFNKYYDHYVQTGEVSRFLDPFKKADEALNLNSGIGVLPIDFEHKRLILSDQDKIVELVEDIHWGYRLNRKIGPPSTERPICRIEEISGSLKIEVKPTTVPSLKFYYFKAPVKPVWAFTTSGNRYVYDDGNSVDIEWSKLLFTEITNRVLNRFGINLREKELVQYMELAKRDEHKVG